MPTILPLLLALAIVILADVFTVAVIMVVVTTLLTPPLLRWTFQNQEGKSGSVGVAAPIGVPFQSQSCVLYRKLSPLLAVQKVR
jgi:hypothetical protein